VPPAARINNANVTGSAINPVTYQGDPRRGALQVQRRLGLPADQPVLPGHELPGRVLPAAQCLRRRPAPAARGHTVQPSYDKDQFESTAWTVNGKIGPLKAVYTGGYLVRNVEQVGDYTNYARGVYADYYQCYGPPVPGVVDPNAEIHLLTRRAPPGTRPSATRTSSTSSA
jgi:hypothetical protein